MTMMMMMITCPLLVLSCYVIYKKISLVFIHKIGNLRYISFFRCGAGILYRPPFSRAQLQWIVLYKHWGIFF